MSSGVYRDFWTSIVDTSLISHRRSFPEEMPLLAFGGTIKPSIMTAIERGEYPEVEYLHLLKEKQVGLLSFDSFQESAVAKSVARRKGDCWALAVYSRLVNAGKSAPIVVTGEDLGFPMAIVNLVSGVPHRQLAVIIHGSYLGSRRAPFALRVLNAVSGLQFLCLSETIQQRLITRHGISPHRVFNIGYGVDTHFFAPLPDNDAHEIPRQIVSAGMAKRDYRTLAAAVRELPDISVKIAADSAWFQNSLDIEGDTLPANVEARSCGDYQGLREWYRAAAFAVVPLYEAVHAAGYAVIIEAMAMGKPVITTRIQGHSDFIIEGETGFYVPPGDPVALRERIQYLMDRPALIRQMGQRARKLIEERFSLEAYTARIREAAGLPLSSPNKDIRANA